MNVLIVIEKSGCVELYDPVEELGLEADFIGIQDLGPRRWVVRDDGLYVPDLKPRLADA